MPLCSPMFLQCITKILFYKWTISTIVETLSNSQKACWIMLVAGTKAGKRYQFCRQAIKSIILFKTRASSKPLHTHFLNMADVDLIKSRLTAHPDFPKKVGESTFFVASQADPAMSGHCFPRYLPYSPRASGFRGTDLTSRAPHRLAYRWPRPEQENRRYRRP